MKDWVSCEEKAPQTLSESPPFIYVRLLLKNRGGLKLLILLKKSSNIFLKIQLFLTFSSSFQPFKIQ